MAVLAPIPRAIVRITASEKAGYLHMVRIPYFRSWRMLSKNVVALIAYPPHAAGTQKRSFAVYRNSTMPQVSDSRTFPRAELQVIFLIFFMKKTGHFFQIVALQ